MSALEKPYNACEQGACLLLYDTKQDIRVQRTLVSLIHDHATVVFKGPASQCLTQQHSVCHVLDLRFLGGAILKPYGISHLQVHKLT
jgi:N-formylglutamate amidohydrolase